MGNRNFGVSSSLRQICAACLPSKVPFFQYDWKKEVWQLYFVAGILAGGFIAGVLLRNPGMMQVNPRLIEEMKAYSVGAPYDLIPNSLFNWKMVFTLKGFTMMVIGGFLVGFGTRWAGGCTSGHSIMGLSNLQWPSLVATICFMAGGFFMANVVLPTILRLVP
jgi:uncharacterized membrane protein YedE/YeeE